MLEPKYNFKEKENYWIKKWQDNKTYKFIKDEREVFSIDTPPPTVSGSIHIGHIFSYSQTEMIARYKRLQNFNVFYPFGYDDNGLPSERLVEKEHKIKAHQLSREEFTKLCLETTGKYEMEFKKLFESVGISADWDLLYRTVSNDTMKVSQLSFLDLVEKQKVYHKKSPALWCIECQTTIAQAELETASIDTKFNYIKFTSENNEFEIATTRPELLPAIVAIMINKDNEKTKHLIGKKALVPLLNIEVPIICDDKVLTDKGSGIVMCCTFGDQTDIEWFKKYDLPLNNILNKYGKIKDEIPSYGGLKIKEAREKILKDLEEKGYLIKQTDITHEVQTHERCGKAIEYSIIKQWFIDIMNHKQDFLKIGNEIVWHPTHMKNRYDEWVKNVMWDWCISRQRYFGIPFPVWYCTKCNQPTFAKKEDLPINPLTTNPKNPCPCGNNEFTPETDIMDTWATSSVTPLINMKYGEKENYEDILKPMSIRTNAADIIRTWDFYTIVKSFYHFGTKPWDNVAVSGFILAGKGEKISKSKNNAKHNPIELISEHSADAVRYWTASGRMGTDITYSDETLKRGKKLINKIWNVSKFIEMHLTDFIDKEFNNFEYFDKWIIGKYQEMEIQYIKYNDIFEVGLALNTLEKFFWNFCDDYIEIVKHRLYRPEEFSQHARYSGQKTIYILLKKILQTFSIYIPFITEEIYTNIYKEETIHKTVLETLNYNFKEEKNIGEELIEIVNACRGAKTNQSLSLKTEIEELTIELNEKQDKALSQAYPDLKASLFIKTLNKQVKNTKNIIIKDIKIAQ